MSHLRRVACLAASALVLVLVAGCGSSTSDPGSSEGPGGGGAPTLSAELTQLEQEPTTIPITTPLPEKPEPGGTLVFLKCDAPQCGFQETTFAAVADLVGWELVSIPFSSADSATLVQGLQQALALKPDAVTFGGPAYELWSQFIPQFEEIGAIIIPSYVGPIPLSDTVPVNIAGPVNDAAMAAILAQWVAEDSGGKAHVLVQTISAFKAIVGWADDFEAELSEICPDCEVSLVNNSAEQFLGAGAAQSIVSEIRKDPSIDYFVGYNGAFFTGLNQQLASAQLDVKVGGMFPLPQNVQDVANGSGGAFLAVSNSYTAWAIFDAALRHAQGAPQVPEAEQVFPVKLVTETSAVESDGNFSGPANTEQLFSELWQVG